MGFGLTNVDPDESDSGEDMASCEDHFKSMSMSPSKPAATPDSPLVSGDTLTLQEAPASEDAASALAGVRSAETTTKEGGVPSAINTPPTARQHGLSMIEQLKLDSDTRNQKHTAEQKEVKSTTDPVPAQQPAASSRPIPNIQTPRGSSSQTDSTPKPRFTQPSNPSVAAAPADRPNPSFFQRDPFFNDPFFTDPFGSASMFNNTMFDGFFGARRPAPRQARPSQDYGSNTTATRGGITGTQLPLCDICNKQLTMEGGITCITCTNGKQVACSTCAPRLACLRQEHEVYKIVFREN